MFQNAYMLAFTCLICLCKCHRAKQIFLKTEALFFLLISKTSNDIPQRKCKCKTKYHLTCFTIALRGVLLIILDWNCNIKPAEHRTHMHTDTHISDLTGMYFMSSPVLIAIDFRWGSTLWNWVFDPRAEKKGGKKKERRNRDGEKGTKFPRTGNKRKINTTHSVIRKAPRKGVNWH